MQQFMLTIKAFKVINLNGYWDLKQQNLYDFIKQIWKLNRLVAFRNQRKYSAYIIDILVPCLKRLDDRHLSSVCIKCEEQANIEITNG